MERLIDNALIYGRLARIDQPHMVARYNSALKALGLPATTLEDFSIDATGYSPEVAAALGDHYYLDPLGTNRRFIILMPDQASLPVINLNFSSTIDFMRRFFDANAEALNTLTLKDVVYGEIEDSTYRVDDLEDILSIKHVEFSVHTVDHLLEKAQRLQGLLTTFESAPDRWSDDTFLNSILVLARACGDIRYNDIVPTVTRFEQRSFWTRHFGGVYVFHDEDDDDRNTVVIGAERDPAFARDTGGLCRYISLDEPERVFRYLSKTKRLEQLNNDWLQGSGQLERRLDFLVRHAVSQAEPDTDLMALDDAWFKNWIYQNMDRLQADSRFNFLSLLKKQAFHGERIDGDDLDREHILTALRARPGHPDQTLTNRLLSEFVPFDFVTRFIVNKEAFYQDYKAFPDPLREYVVHTVTSTYFEDKAGFRARLFDAHAVEKPAPRHRRKDDDDDDDDDDYDYPGKASGFIRD